MQFHGRRLALDRWAVWKRVLVWGRLQVMACLEGVPIVSLRALQLVVRGVLSVPTEPSASVGFNMKFKLLEECGDALVSPGECPGTDTGRMY
jgi:hypothetical protein